jgi:hypothetical protein
MIAFLSATSNLTIFTLTTLAEPRPTTVQLGRELKLSKGDWRAHRSCTEQGIAAASNGIGSLSVVVRWPVNGN